MKRMLRIVYRPKADPRRHTTFLEITYRGPLPNDFGDVEKVEVFNPRKLPKIKLKKPTAADIAWAREQLKKPCRCGKPTKGVFYAADEFSGDHLKWCKRDRK